MKLQCLIALLTVSTSSSLVALAQKVNHSVNHHCVAGVHDADNNACGFLKNPNQKCQMHVFSAISTANGIFVRTDVRKIKTELNSALHFSETLTSLNHF